MPKFNVYDETPRGVNMETGEEGPERLRRVSVGWTKDCYVQVGVGWVEPPSNFVVTSTNIMSPPPKTLSALSAAIDETDERGNQWQAQWCDMNRHTINNLIRALRKARDEAFGRDE